MIFPVLLLASCTSESGPGDAAAQSAAGYLTAMVERDGDRMSALSCAIWEDDAMLELDALMTVEAALQDVVCTQTGTDGEITLVNCQGKIVTTYNEEQTEIDLSRRTFEMTQSAGEWLVCGYR